MRLSGPTRDSTMIGFVDNYMRQSPVEAVSDPFEKAL
jgi:hypothetical protein